MTSKSAWFPLYIGDYQADTMHLTRDQHGAYLLLMMAYYRRGKALPDDNRYLAGIVKASGGEWRYLRPIMAEFFRIDGGMWHHKRIDAEIAEQTDLQEARSERARTNANKRWDKSAKSMPEPMLQAMPPHDEIRSAKFGGANRLQHQQNQWPGMLLSQSQEEPPPLSPPVNGRGKKRLSPIEGIAKGFADALAQRARDRRPDHPADVALLDDQRAGSLAADHRRRLA